MKTETLKELGLSQEQIDKVMEENGKDIAKIQTKFNEKSDEVTVLTEDRDKFKGDYENISKTLKTTETERDNLKNQFETSNSELVKYQTSEKVRNAGIAKEFHEFVSHEVSKLVSDEKDYDTALQEYVEKNPQYKEGEIKKIQTSPDLSGQDQKPKSSNQDLNEAILKAAGK